MPGRSPLTLAGAIRLGLALPYVVLIFVRSPAYRYFGGR